MIICGVGGLDLNLCISLTLVLLGATLPFARDLKVASSTSGGQAESVLRGQATAPCSL